jgi:hypothetical protein
MAGVVARAEAGFHWMSLKTHKEDRQKQKGI